MGSKVSLKLREEKSVISESSQRCRSGIDTGLKPFLSSATQVGPDEKDFAFVVLEVLRAFGYVESDLGDEGLEFCRIGTVKYIRSLQDGLIGSRRSSGSLGKLSHM